MRDALRVALALAPAPNGFTVAEFTAKVYALAGHDRTGHSIRQTAYDPRKLRGKPLVDKPGRSPQLPRLAASGTHDRRRLALRDQGIAPILAGVRTPWDANAHTGPASTATTNESASTCKRSSPISPSKYR